MAPASMGRVTRVIGCVGGLLLVSLTMVGLEMNMQGGASTQLRDLASLVLAGGRESADLAEAPSGAAGLPMTTTTCTTAATATATATTTTATATATTTTATATTTTGMPPKWAKYLADAGFRQRVELVCQGLENSSKPLFHGIGSDDLQSKVDEACGFPCVRDGKGWRAATDLGGAQLFWTLFAESQRRELGKSNKSCTDEGQTRYLKYSAPSRGQGLGNMVQGLQTAVLLAAYSGRQLLIHWPTFHDLTGPRYSQWSQKPCGNASIPKQQLEVFNFGKTQPRATVLAALNSSRPGVVGLISNLGVDDYLHAQRLELGALGLPGDTFQDLVGRKGCLVHFVLGASSSLRESVVKQLGSAPAIGLQARFGDTVSFKMGSDRRQVLVNPTWGLKTTRAVTEQMLTCAGQLCQRMRQGAAAADAAADPGECRVLFEADSDDALGIARRWQGSGEANVTVLLPKGRPEHSSKKAMGPTLVSFFSLAASPVVLSTSSSFGAEAAQLGAVLAGPYPFRLLKFESFLARRAEAGQPSNYTLELCAENITATGA